MATIQQDLAAIRTAVYGKDVREAIADGIENCYNESAQSGYSQLNNRMTVAEDNIQTLENTVDTMIGTDTTLINRITTAESNIDTLTEGQNTLGVDISSVSGRVDETETDIAVLESMTEPTRNKLYITNHQKPGSFTINGVTVTINTDGSFSFNGTVVSADAVIGLMGCTGKDDHKIPLGTQYTFGRKSENTGSNGTIRFRYDDESTQNVTISNGETVTFLSKASVYLMLPRGQAYTSTGKYYFWAESGDTIHEFLPYGNTPVDITAREAIETSMTEMTTVMNDISEMSYNLFYMTGYEKPNTAWSTVRNGIKFRVNEDMTISFSGTCSAHTNFPLMGCTNSTDSYVVTGGRNLYYTRTLVSGTYSGNLPLKIVVKNESAVTFSYDDSRYLNDDACMYLQVRSGATFGTDSSPTTFAFQIVEGTEDKKIYEPYGIYIPKDTYARGVIPRVDALETENLPAIDRLPSYYHDNNYIENKLQTILTRAAQLETQSGNEVKHGYDTFAFITDMHLWWLDYGVNDKTLRNDPPKITVSNGMQSVKLLQTVRERANVVKIFNGGDLLRGNVTTLANAQVWMGKVKEFLDPVWDNTYFVIGNHEWNNPDSSDDDPDKINRTAIYSQFVGDKSDRYGSISPVGDYWIDNVAEEIRYFFIHSNQSANIVDESIKWFGDEMLDIPDEYTVVVITHAAAGGYSTWGTFTAGFTQIANIINAARTRVTYTYGDWSWDYKYAKYDIACVLSGHTHFDQIDHIPQDDAHGVPVIAIEADHWKSGVGTNGRNPRTITEQAFDVVQVDTTTRNVYMTRIGYGNDRSYTYPAGVANGNVKPSEVVLSNQGTENAGKALIVGDDGRVTTGDAGIPEAVKDALIEIMRHVVYADDDGQTYLTNLIAAFGRGDYAYYSVNNQMTHAVSSNGVAVVIQGMQYTATIKGEAGYTLDSVTITMGGTDVTSIVYANGAISIPEVTGNVMITATGSKHYTFLGNYVNDLYSTGDNQEIRLHDKNSRVAAVGTSGEIREIGYDGSTSQYYYAFKIPSGAHTIQFDDGFGSEHQYLYGCIIARVNGDRIIKVDTSGTNIGNTFDQTDISDYNDGTMYAVINVFKWDGSWRTNGRPNIDGSADLSNVDTSNWKVIIE